MTEGQTAAARQTLARAVRDKALHQARRHVNVHRGEVIARHGRGDNLQLTIDVFASETVLYPDDLDIAQWVAFYDLMWHVEVGDTALLTYHDGDWSMFDVLADTEVTNPRRGVEAMRFDIRRLRVDTATNTAEIANLAAGASVTNEGLSLDDPRVNGSLGTAVSMLPASDPGRRTGRIVIPAGTVHDVPSQIALNDASGVVIEGVGGMSDNAGRPLLRWTGGAGSGPMISAASASGVELKNLVLTYNNAAYDGDLIKLGHSARGVDPFYFKMDRCYVAGISGAAGARSLVNLDRCAGATISGTQFISAQHGIWGVDGSYANAVTINEECIFNYCSTAAIRAPGEAWSIIGAVFEPSADGAPRGILSSGVIALGLTIQGCWFGDVTQVGAPTGFWIDVRGRGVNVLGNRIALEVAGVPHVAVIFRQVIGGTITGNRFTAGGGLAVNSDPKAIDFVLLSTAQSTGVSVENNQFTNIRMDIDETGLGIGEYRNNTGLADKRIGLPAALPIYTVATLPAAASYPASMIYVSDGGASATVQVSNGSSWVPVG